MSNSFIKSLFIYIALSLSVASYVFANDSSNTDNQQAQNNQENQTSDTGNNQDVSENKKNTETPAQQLKQTIRDNMSESDLIRSMMDGVSKPSQLINQNSSGERVITLPSLPANGYTNVPMVQQQSYTKGDIPNHSKIVLSGVAVSEGQAVAWVRIAGYEKTLLVGDEIKGHYVKAISVNGIELASSMNAKHGKFYGLGKVLPF